MSRPTLKSLSERLDNAASYIKSLEQRITHLEQTSQTKPQAPRTQSSRLQAVIARTAAMDAARRNSA